jgi:hypothetical protein
MERLKLFCGKVTFVRAVFIIGRQTIVIICRHQMAAATVKVTADCLQHLFKNAVANWVGNQLKDHLSAGYSV